MVVDFIETLIGVPPTGFEALGYVGALVFALMLLRGVLDLFGIFSRRGMDV